jgi:hypothetical protein
MGIAKETNMDLQTLRRLNPELRFKKPRTGNFLNTEKRWSFQAWLDWWIEPSAWFPSIFPQTDT